MSPRETRHETIPLPENAEKVRRAQVHIAIGALPNPFDPRQNPNYGPREKCELAETADDLSDLLNDVRAVFRRYVDMTNEQNAIVSLWAAHTHLIPVLQFTPYLSITSAERESGKSRVLDILSYLVPKPWKTERTSAAALVRKTDK